MTKNILLEPVEYKIEKSNFGTWRKHLNEQGRYFAEFTSHKTFLNLPLVHYTIGINPETGKHIPAKGIIAIGRIAMGGLAIGQAAFGVITIGQLSLGLLFGLGQLATGFLAIGQAAFGVYFGLGQIATGYIAIGQFALGFYVLAQLGFGEHVIMPKQVDPVAVEFFQGLKERILGWFK